MSRLREIEGVQTLLLEDGAGGAGMISVSCVLGEKDIREVESRTDWRGVDPSLLGSRNMAFAVGRVFSGKVWCLRAVVAVIVEV